MVPFMTLLTWLILHFITLSTSYSFATFCYADCTYSQWIHFFPVIPDIQVMKEKTNGAVASLLKSQVSPTFVLIRDGEIAVYTGNQFYLVGIISAMLDLL